MRIIKHPSLPKYGYFYFIVAWANRIDNIYTYAHKYVDIV